MHRWLISFAAALFFAAMARDGVDRWVDRTRLPPLTHAVATEVVDRDGALLRAYPVEDGLWRLATAPRDVDPAFLKMLIAIEDKRFHTHIGVDPRAMLRAGWQALRHGRVVSGASTLTMQTARLIENSGTGGWPGKLRQIRVALALERRLSKDDILSLYLTHAPYGANIEGVRAASYAWFGKPPRRLNAEEATLLIALPQAPTARRPDRAPSAATAARDRILARLDLPPARRPVPDHLRQFPAKAPHLANRARSADPHARHIAVTLHAPLQLKLENLAARAVQSLPPDVSAALLVADHQTGEILAYVGTAHFGRAQGAGFVDMVQAVRSPGSTLKPLIYALAFDQGLAQPATLISDTPVAFGRYAPQNFDGHFRGDVTVQQALEQSLNIPPVRLTEAMGPHRLMAGLHRAGTEPQLAGGKPGLAVALGGVGLTLKDLVQLYAGLANGGIARPLHWRATSAEPAAKRIVSRSAAWQVEHILAGIPPPQGQPRGHIAYKTGTSYGHRDAWAIGWDGRHVIGVWLGRPDGTPVPGIFGGEIAAPILFEAFDRLKPVPTILRPPPPETLLLSNAELPKPLRRFVHPTAAGPRDTSTLAVAFPPNGANLRLAPGDPLVIKVEGGTPPFALVADGRPVRTGHRDRTLLVGDVATGFTHLQVVDADGHSTEARIRISH